MVMWTIVLGPQKRTANNFQAWINDIPALYGLRKDHKVTTDPIAGPPTRPVCGANIASNYRISYFLSMIIRPIIRMSPDVCDSTEDLGWINDCNNTCDLTGCMVGSMDVVSLYPSIDVDFAVEKFVEMINESQVEFRNVNTEELGLLLRLTCNNEFLDKHNLSSFCPSRCLRVWTYAIEATLHIPYTVLRSYEANLLKYSTKYSLKVVVSNFSVDVDVLLT
ncbi:Hypothetical predicted protein [Octopus vulgaris]|uniref:Reverse transcriptase domain-containing protein n=1 Tax=Octopus vulgaris TaxID=6645 RepID=A0AA36F5E5_OCTVU|nr:Hypothetical predicted protein [Octopus vulgaris]